jgi:N-acetylglutamate synthase-like GNAT family acetyltransferase
MEPLTSVDCSVRPATRNDALEVRRLVHRTGINPLGLKWERFLVAEDGEGKFLGCIQLKDHRDGSFELASLAVEEPYRGRGIARVLIEHLLAESPRPLYLTCRAELGPLYEKFGFRSVDLSDSLSPRYRVIRRIFDFIHRIQGREGGLIMRLD